MASIITSDDLSPMRDARTNAENRDTPPISDTDTNDIDPVPDTDSNSESEQWSKGRMTSLFIAAMLSGISIVLAFAYLFSRDHKYGISLKPLYVWEIFLFSAAALSMFVFNCMRQQPRFIVDNAKPFSDAYMDFLYDTRNQLDIQNESVAKPPFWTYIPLRAIGLCVCCVGSIVLPACRIYRDMFDTQCFDSSFRILNAISKGCRIIFYLTETAFLLKYKTTTVRNICLRHFMSTVVAANFTLCVDVYLNIKLVKDTVDFQAAGGIRHSNVVKDPLFVTCDGNRIAIDYVSEWMYKFSYQFPVEFMVLAMCYFGAIWGVSNPVKPDIRSLLNIPVQRMESVFTSTGADDDDDGQLNYSHHRIVTRTALRFLRYISTAAKRVVVFISRWTFLIAFVLIFGIFIIILFNEITYMAFIKSDSILIYNRFSNSTNMKSYYAVIQTIYHYTYCIVAPFTWLLAARKVRMIHKQLNPNDILLFIATTGHMIFVMFETVDFGEVVFNKRAGADSWVFFIKMLLKYQGLIGEAMVVFIASKMEIKRRSFTSGRQRALKIVVVFIGVFNMERWFTDNFLPPNVIRYVEEINYQEMYGAETWWLLTAYLYPFVIIFRVAMVTICFETSVRIKREQLKMQ